MEFVITTDLSVLPAAIECNAEEVKAQLSERLEHYKSIVVTTDTMKEAKADKAALNKLCTAIEDRRKEIKRQCLAPYEDFERQCREITGMIKEPIGVIDTQLKAIADGIVAQKHDALQDYFGQIVAGMHDVDVSWIELGRILNPKWKNATMKLDTLKQEIRDTVQHMFEEMQELQKIYGNSPLFTAIWGKYLETYNKGETLAYAAILMQQEQQRQLAPPPPAPEPVPTPEPVQDEQPVTGLFRVTGTRAQIKALGEFIKRTGIKIEIIPEKKEEKNNGSHE